MKTLLLTLTYLVGAGELILAIYFWATNSKSEIRKIVSWLAFVTGMWVLCITSVVAFSNSDTVGTILSWNYIFGALMATAVLHFSIVYPYKSFAFDKLHASLIYLPCAILTSIQLYNQSFISSFKATGELSGNWIEGPLFPIYGVYLSIIFFLALLILYKKYSVADGMHKNNLLINIFLLFIGGSPAALFYLIIPIFTGVGIQPFIGTLSTVVWLGGVIYIITRK